MTVKTSISLTDAQEAFARRQVEAGHYPSLSAVLQRGLEMLRQETEQHEAEVAALKALLEERMKGPFVPLWDGVEEMLAEKRKTLGLED